MKYLREFATEAEYEAFVASGEMKKPNVSFVAETMGVHYAQALKKGVFIQHIDGTLYTTEEWQTLGFSADVANGVAVSTDKAAFVIAKENLGKKFWGPYAMVSGATVAADATVAKTDMQGLANTKAMVAQANTGAAAICNAYVFPDGKTKGYLPAIGELYVAYQNMAAINSALSAVGSAYLYNAASYYWSSTQRDASNAWYLTFGGGGVYGGQKIESNTCVALPFGTL